MRASFLKVHVIINFLVFKLSITLSSNSGFLLPDLNTKHLCFHAAWISLTMMWETMWGTFQIPLKWRPCLPSCWEGGQPSSDRPFCYGLNGRVTFPMVGPLLREACIRWLMERLDYLAPTKDNYKANQGPEFSMGSIQAGIWPSCSLTSPTTQPCFLPLPSTNVDPPKGTP